MPQVRFIDALSASGLRAIEATSFVNPKWVPQMADASDVLARISQRPGVSYSVLVPNLKVDGGQDRNGRARGAHWVSHACRGSRRRSKREPRRLPSLGQRAMPSGWSSLLLPAAPLYPLR